MIPDSDVIQLGTCTRTHGRRGELHIISDNDLLSIAEDPQFLLLRLDNILTPFRLVEWREKGANAYIVALDGITTEEQAQRFCGKPVYLLRGDLSDNPDEPLLMWQDLIGYEVIDDELGPVGHIKNVDDSTINTLFLLDSEAVIPAHEDFITEIDSDQRKLYVSLPAGLIEK